MSRQFWAVNGLLIIFIIFTSCQSSSFRVEISQDYYNIGNAYSDLGEYAKSAEYYQRALDLNPALNQAAFNLARTNLEIDDYESALKLLLGLESEDPENLFVLEMLGYSWYKMGDEDRAGEYYRKSLNIDPAHPRSLYNMSILEKRKNNWGMSRFYLEKLLKQDDKKEYRILLAELAVAEEEYESAIGYYEDLVLEYGGDSEIYASMKDMYMETEMYYKVLEMIDLLIEAGPEEEVLKSLYFEKSTIEVQYLDDIIMGQADLIRALDEGYSDKEALEDLLSLVDPHFQGDLEKIIKEHLIEPEPEKIENPDLELTVPEAADSEQSSRDKTERL